MMLVDTYLAQSVVDGLGLFAAVDIPVGTKIWQFDDGFDIILDEKDFARMPDWQAKYFLKYCFKFQGRYFFCVDNARYMNHSAEPNTYESPEATWSSRDIKAREEIMCDYRRMGVTQEDLVHNMQNITVLK